MKVSELLSEDTDTVLMLRPPGTAAKIAKEIVARASKNIAPADVEKAVNQAVDRFVKQLRDATVEELKYAGIKSL